MKKTTGGFSFLEIIVSIFILLTFVLFLIQAMPQIMKNQRASKDVGIGTFLCQSKIEEIRVNRGKKIPEGISTENITVEGKSSPYVYEIEKKTWAQDPNFWEFVVSVKKFFGGQLVKKSYASMAYALPKEASGEGEQFFLAQGAYWPSKSNTYTLIGPTGVMGTPQGDFGAVMYGVRFNPSTNCVEICVFATSVMSLTPPGSSYSAVLRNWTQINPPAPKPIKRLFIIQQEPLVHGVTTSLAGGTNTLNHYKLANAAGIPGLGSGPAENMNGSDIIIFVQDTDNNLWSAIGNLATLGITDEGARGIRASYGGIRPIISAGTASLNFYTRGSMGMVWGPGGWGYPTASPWQQMPNLKLR